MDIFQDWKEILEGLDREKEQKKKKKKKKQDALEEYLGVAGAHTQRLNDTLDDIY